MLDLALMTIFINHQIYVGYSSSQYRTEVLQIVSKPPSNARSCGTGAPHDVALTRTSGV
jgi:hypothetical protein